MKANPVFTNCKICGKEVRSTPYRQLRGQDKFCSREHYHQSRKGVATWNMGKRTAFVICPICNKKRYYQGKTGNRMHWECWVKSIQGKKIPREIIMKGWEKLKIMGFPNRKGKKHSLKSRIKISSRKRNIPLNQWGGFSMSLNHSVRELPEYKLWQRSILERDNYTCLWCGKRGGTLHIDHIRALSLLIDEAVAQYGRKDLELIRNYAPLWNISNGRSLCEPCHKTTDNWGAKSRWAIKKTQREEVI